VSFAAIGTGSRWDTWCRQEFRELNPIQPLLLCHVPHKDLGIPHRERDLFREEKFHCSVGETIGYDPIALSAIVLLEWGDEIALDSVTGGNAVSAVLRDTCYRPEMLEIMGRSAEQVALVAQIISSTQVYRLTRPRDFDAIDEVCALVEARLGG